jgi:NhaA family Na+:H+ antiporter
MRAIGRRLASAAGRFLDEPSLLMIVAAVLALGVTNLAPDMHFERLWTESLQLTLVGQSVSLALGPAVVDGLMTIFFLCVGLEIRRDIAFGPLSSARAAATPVVCAAGGMVVPMGIYWLIAGRGKTSSGWAIPSATDVALAVGIAALVAPRLSRGARAFLLTLAVVDDIGGIAVIGVFYTHDIALLPTCTGLMLAVASALAVRSGRIRLMPALTLLLPAWLLMWPAHIEPPIIGAVFALLIPASATFAGRSVRTEIDAVLSRLGPFVAFVILPLFAAVVASITLHAGGIVGGVSLAVALGLFLGKPIGIFGAFMLATRTGVGEHPSDTSSHELLGVSILAGVGFTVSLFIAHVGLAGTAFQDSATVGVFAGSLLATCAGAWYFAVAPRVTPSSVPASEV